MPCCLSFMYIIIHDITDTAVVSFCMHHCLVQCGVVERTSIYIFISLNIIKCTKEECLHSLSPTYCALACDADDRICIMPLTDELRDDGDDDSV